jgi:O-antigen ligase
MIINLPIMISNLSDEYAVYFIGGKNSLSMFLIPGAFLCLINSLETEKRISMKYIIVMLLCLLSVLIGDSGTGIVVVFFVVVLMILMTKIKVSKWIYIFMILLVYASIILFSTVFLSTDLWIFITGILGKDSDLTSRITIWNIAKDFISDNWLLGPGRGTEIIYVNKWGERQLIYEAHNLILEVLMEGGVVAFTIFSALFYNIVDKLDMNDIRNKMVFIALCALLINGFTESTVNNLFVTVVLGVACHYAMENRGKKISNE